MRNTIICADALTFFRQLDAESIHTIMTSPPYYGLRSYATTPIIWSDVTTCDHVWVEAKRDLGRSYQVADPKWPANQSVVAAQTPGNAGSFCQHCGGWYGDLGLEPTPELFVEHLTMIFREARRVLHRHGILWLNIGDSYWNGKGKSGSTSPQVQQLRKAAGVSLSSPAAHIGGPGLTTPTGGKHPTIKPKDLILIPFLLAASLRDDGWYLRSDCIWAKDSVMPESVVDRPSKSHEYVFMLTKRAKYYFNRVAMAEKAVSGHASGNGFKRDARLTYGGRGNEASWQPTLTRNRRTVWRLNPKPSDWSYCSGCDSLFVDKERRAIRSEKVDGKPRRYCPTCGAYDQWVAHFAAYPKRLVEIALLGGAPPMVCDRCNMPWKPIIKKEVVDAPEHRPYDGAKSVGQIDQFSQRRMSGNVRRLREAGRNHDNPFPQQTIVGWLPACKCADASPLPGLVADPFMGSGTTALAARDMGLAYVGADLNPLYVKVALARLERKPVPKPQPKPIPERPVFVQMTFLEEPV